MTTNIFVSGNFVITFIEECRQSDYQEKKGQATIYKTPHRKLTIEQHGSAKTNPGVNSGYPAISKEMVS
jgi:hypothetical protein